MPAIPTLLTFVIFGHGDVLRSWGCLFAASTAAFTAYADSAQWFVILYAADLCAAVSISGSVCTPAAVHQVHLWVGQILTAYWRGQLSVASLQEQTGVTVKEIFMSTPHPTKHPVTFSRWVHSSLSCKTIRSIIVKWKLRHLLFACSQPYRQPTKYLQFIAYEIYK